MRFSCAASLHGTDHQRANLLTTFALAFHNVCQSPVKQHSDTVAQGKQLIQVKRYHQRGGSLLAGFANGVVNRSRAGGV